MSWWEGVCVCCVHSVGGIKADRVDSEKGGEGGGSRKETKEGLGEKVERKKERSVSTQILGVFTQMVR